MQILLSYLTEKLSKEYKYLGLMFSSNGTFNHVPMTLANQANKALFLLIKRTIRLGHPNPNLLCKLYDTLLRQIHEYGSEIWGHYSVSMPRNWNNPPEVLQICPWSPNQCTQFGLLWWVWLLPGGVQKENLDGEILAQPTQLGHTCFCSRGM